MEDTPRFILIDDNHINSFITERLLKTMKFDGEITFFQDANKALQFIQSTEGNKYGKSILLLDLHMPLMSGTSFLQNFEQLPEDMRNRYAVYIVTSSINPEDVRSVSQYSFVKKFVSKPLTASIINDILQEV